jgi:phosphoribosylglycinamide formyltransferase 1
MRLGVLVSGRGTNLRNLVELGFDVAAVATNRPSCPAAAFAREREIALGEFSQKRYGSLQTRDAAMARWLEAGGVDLVVNAGYDRILSPEFTTRFAGRMLNVHPSLLPAFGGTMHAVEEALAHGARITGCTVHLVTDEVDSGPILLQAAVPVLEDDDPESLRARIQAEEHRLLPQAIRLMEARLAAEKSASIG